MTNSFRIKEIARRISICFLCSFVLSGLFFLTRPAHAQLTQSQQVLGDTASAAGISGGTDLVQIIGRIIYIFLGALGIVFLGLLLYAGYLWMTDGGSGEKIKQSKAYIRNAVIGLFIIASAWAITAFILNSLADVAGGGGGINGGGGGGAGLVGSSGSLGSGIIEYHLPERNATNVPRNTPIIITFKQPMNPASFIQGWTLAASSSVDGLNTDMIQVFKTGDETSALTTDKARVNFTQDKKTFVIRPIEKLGSSSTNVKYTVRLKGGKSGLQLENGDAAFGGSFSGGYEWGFEVSTFLDLTPPKVIAAIPYPGGKYARNVVIQVTFNEAIDPTSASGIFKDKAGFTNIEVHAGAGATAPLEGEYRVSNQYRTVEFLTFEKCGVNSCGKDVFCLPPDATLETTVKAATLSSDPPAAQFTSQGYDGITDVVGNSLDGDGDGKTSGPPSDSYVWSFGTTSQVKLTPPMITETVPDATPGSGQSNRPLDEPVTATFDSLMQASTITSEAARVEPKGPGEKDPDTFWYNVSMTLLNSKNAPLEPGDVAEKSQLVIKHRPYIPSGLTPSELNYYNPFLLSDLQDSYQNCFNPASSNKCTGILNCCNNSPQSPDCKFKP